MFIKNVKNLLPYRLFPLLLLGLFTFSWWSLYGEITGSWLRSLLVVNLHSLSQNLKNPTDFHCEKDFHRTQYIHQGETADIADNQDTLLSRTGQSKLIFIRFSCLLSPVKENSIVQITIHTGISNREKKNNFGSSRC